MNPRTVLSLFAAIISWSSGIRSNWCFLPKNGRQVNCRWLLSGVLLFASYDDFIWFPCRDRCSPATVPSWIGQGDSNVVNPVPSFWVCGIWRCGNLHTQTGKSCKSGMLQTDGWWFMLGFTTFWNSMGWTDHKKGHIRAYLIVLVWSMRRRG